MKKQNKRLLLTTFFLTLILAVGAILRLWNLAFNPPELFSDEITGFVSAQSIIETGKDTNGKQSIYLYDRVELRPPIYGYSSYLSTLIFGKTPFAIRLPAVFFGILTIFFLFLLVSEITNNKELGILSAFLLAILPWHIHYSRVGWEPASLLPFFLFSIFLLIKGINKNNPFFTVSGFVILGITIYTYQAAPLFSFTFLATLLGLNHKFFLKNKRLLILGVIIYLFVSIPFIFTAISQPLLLGRARRISTFSQGINSKTIILFIKNYVSHFHPSFLFTDGDPNLRHGVQKGVLYLWMFPFIIAGLYFLLKKVKFRWRTFLVFWFLVFPLGGALTNDGIPHATRTLIGAPLFCIISALGIWEVFMLIYKKRRSGLILGITSFVLATVIVYSLASFSKEYFFVYPKVSAPWWQYGQAKIFTKIRSIENDFERVCLGNLDYWSAGAYIPYYLKNSPLAIIENPENPICKERGSIVILPKEILPPKGASLLQPIIGLDNNSTFLIYSIGLKR